MSIIVRRRGLEAFLQGGGRKLMYGRRKTGKTYYARIKLRHYDYYIVRPGGTFYNPDNQVEYEVKGFLNLCRRTPLLIIDEFHRAPPLLFDNIQAGNCPENLLLITSTMHYYKRALEYPDAPLKGLFLAKKVGLIDPVDLALHNWGRVTPDLVEHLIFYQEPVLVGRRIDEDLAYSWSIARSLVGEVLTEEDYEDTRRYHHILEAVAAGKSRISEIASYLYSRGLLPSQSPSHVTKYIDIMVKTGLLERIPVYGRKRRSILRHYSPLTHVAYYLNGRYGLWDYPAPEEYVIELAREQIPLLVEVFVERLLASSCRLQPVKILDPEVDVALADHRSLRLAVEVKWREKASRQELRKAAAKLAGLNAGYKMVVTKNPVDYEPGMPTMTLTELVDLVRRAGGGCPVDFLE